MNFKRIEKLKKALMLILTLLVGVSGFAQNESETVDKYRAVYSFEQPTFNTEGGSTTEVVSYKPIAKSEYGVYYEYDKALGKLLDLHKATNSITTEGPGFRIQIYAGSKMELANGTKADFVQNFGHDEFAVYQNWQPPHFRVRVGDFLSRQEAMRNLSNIRKVFPDAFVVMDQIKLPKYKKQNIKASLPESKKDLSPE